MTRPTARGAALFALAAGTYIAARVLGTWELYLVALAFAGMAGVGWILVLIGARRLWVDRSVTPERPVAGDPLEFSFRVGTGWRLPGLQVTLADAVGRFDGIPEPIVVEGIGLRAGRTITTGPWPAQRGIHRLSAFTAVVEDPLGLIRARRLVGDPLRLVVAPRLDDLSSCAPCAEAGVHHGGGRLRLPARDAWELRGIRPHVPGESLNRVDWKSTAKTGSLMLREMEAATERDLTVLLSGAVECDEGVPPDSSFEVAVRAAGSMAAFTLRTGHSVSLLLPEHDWRPVRLAPGAASHRTLLGALAEATPSGPARLGPSLEAIVGGRAEKRRRVVTLVVLCLDRELASALLRLRRQDFAVSVVHVVQGGRGAAHDFATANAAAPDVALIATLSAAGVRYLALNPGDDLHAALAAGPPTRLRRAR
jgi:uncharacterized protein (DUF58 family)